MYKPFTKEYAISVAYKLQSSIGKNFPDENLVFTIENITPLPANEQVISKLRTQYFMAANKHIKHAELATIIENYKGEEYDVAAFAKAEKDGGFTTTIIPVGLIGVKEDGIDWGFSFLES